MRRGLASTMAVLLAGCAFDESVPPTADIQCATSEQCPRGWRCAPMLGRCVQRSDVDVVGPALAGAVTPALVRPGEAVSVSVSADEALLGAPEVEVRVGTTVRPVPRTGEEAWTFVVPTDEPDGLLTFFGSAEDTAGNGTRGVLLGAARVDGTPPAVLSARVTPEVVSPSTIATVVVSLSEDVRPKAQLVLRDAQGLEVARLEAADQASTLRFEFLPPTGVGDGGLWLQLEALVDLAGNAAPPLDAGRLLVDGTPPVVGPLGLAGRRFSAQPGFDTVSVPVDVTGASFVQVCLAADCRDATGTSLVAFTVVSGADGPRIVRVRARDVAGNTTEVAESVDFDFQAPRVESLEVEPRVIPPGGQVLVSATFDEPLASGAALVVQQDDGGWSDRLVSSRAGSRLASFVVRMPQVSQASATYLLRLEGLSDEVANAGSPADGGSFLLDADPPVFQPSDAGFPRRYSRQPGHDVVALPTLPVLGAVRQEVCLDSACTAADGGTATFPVGSAAAEGGHAVTWRAVDEVGNTAVLVDNVTFDFTPPRVLSAGALYSPPPGCPLTSVSALTTAGGVAVSLTTDEPVASVPALDAGFALTFTRTSGADGGQAFAFAATAPAGLDSGVVGVTAWLVDDVANAAEAPVTALAVDTTPPPAVSPAQEEGFLYTRVPFGAQRTNDLPRFTVEADAGTFEPGTFVQVWNSGSTTTGLLLAAVRANDTGALPTVVLPPADLSRVYFKQYDTACNAQPSGATAAAVPRTEAVLTLGSKVAGQTVPNPNRYVEDFGAGTDYSNAPPAREWGSAELSRADAVFARSRTPMLQWQTPTPSRDTYVCVAYNPGTRQTVLVTGDRAYVRGTSGWIPRNNLPDPLKGTCTPGSTREGPGLLMRSGSVYLHWWSDMVSIIPTYSSDSNGYTVVSAQGDFISVDVPGGTLAVYRGDPDYSWNPVPIENATPYAWVEPQNFTSLGGRPVLVDAYEAWILTDGSTAGTMRWESLGVPPTWPEASAPLGGSAFVMVGASGATWVFDDGTGAWQPGPPHPLQATAIGSYTDEDGLPNFLADDWSVARFDGTSWSMVMPPAPRTSGYRALGHSPLYGTLATQGSPPGLVFHGAFPDGGMDVTWTWDGNTWTQRPGTTPASPTGVATTEADGGVILLGLERGTSTMSTYRFRGTSWQKVAVTAPTPRSRHGLARLSNGNLVVAGGVSPTSQYLTDWATLSGSTWFPWDPSWWGARARPAMGYDPLRRLAVVFGGENPQALGDTFEFGSFLNQVQTPVAPLPRAGASLVWDPTYEALVLVGGGTAAETWAYDGAWRNLTPYSATSPGNGLAAWDPVQQAVLALTPQGESYLSPHLPVEHRFIPSLSGVSMTNILRGSVMAVFPSGAPAGLRYAAYLGNAWTSVGAARSGTPVALDQTAAQRVLPFGLRIGTGTLDTATLETDYFELTLRYR